MLFRFTLAAFLATIVGLNLDVAPSQTQSESESVCTPSCRKLACIAPGCRRAGGLPRHQRNVLQVHRPALGP